jgi:hypothetical protein
LESNESGTGGGAVITELAGPRMPADHGLSSLALLMQLGGSIFLGLMVLLALFFVTLGASPMVLPVFAVAVLGAIRSAFHRAAGTRLLYGGIGGPLRGIRVYGYVAIAQTALTVAVLKSQLGMGGPELAGLALTYLAWPVTLLVLTFTPRFRRYEEELPTSEDLGFEGVSVLMVLFGVIGAIFSGLMVLVILKSGGSALATPAGVLLLGVFGALLVRAILHVIAGKQGVAGVHPDHLSEATERYCNFGVISAILSGAALFLIMILHAPSMQVMLSIGVLAYWLLIWPLLLRRFYGERTFGVFLAGESAPVYRRAPDRGLTSLGWLLLAFGVLGLAGSLPQALFGSDMGGGEMGMLFASNDLAQTFGRSPWWSVLMASVQLWAAWELITMSDRHKIAASAYGALGVALTLYLIWPIFSYLRDFGTIGYGGGFSQHLIFGVIAMQLVIPVGALVLANRAETPEAQARLRTPDQA